MTSDQMDLFAVSALGLETSLSHEIKALKFTEVRAVPGGVSFKGDWSEVWRANLQISGATRILLRLTSFRTTHLAKLAHAAKTLPWSDWIRTGSAVTVDATCRGSRLYHSGAVKERIEDGIANALGLTSNYATPVSVFVRLYKDICTISLDTSGEPLHKRGYKQAVGKAPMRETLAAMFLRQCGYKGDEPVLDPMCGSGSFVLEAAAKAAGQVPGQHRSFAFEELPSFDEHEYEALRGFETKPAESPQFFGYDRDQGAIKGAVSNAKRAGLEDWCRFAHQSVSDLEPPIDKPGLIMVNPPYGGRIGEKAELVALYGSLGKVLKQRLPGWRVGLVTSEAGLAHKTGLPFYDPAEPVDHGGLKVQLCRSKVF